MPPRSRQYRSPKDLLDRLARDLEALQQAGSPAQALDVAITFACTAWNLTNWLWRPISRDAGLRRQLSRLGGHSLSSLDQDTFAATLAEQCGGLELCAVIAADPTKLVAKSTGCGWLLHLIEDGELKPIELSRLEAVLTFWRQFARTYELGSRIHASAAAVVPLRRAVNGRVNGRSLRW
jgi:hypothetical protein